MKYLRFAALAVFISAPAIAADLPAGPSPDVRAPAQVVAYSWSGFYAGFNAGYGWGRVSDPTDTFHDNLDGFVGGGQVGANIQNGAFVGGIEADFQGTTQRNTFNGTLAGIAFSIERSVPWFGTVRGRLGGAFGPHLIYLTGGGAFGNFKVEGCALGVCVSDNDSKFAWTAGGGWEWMFAPKWSAKVEYLYFDTGNTTVTLFGVPVSGTLRDHIVRAGI